MICLKTSIVEIGNLCNNFILGQLLIACTIQKAFRQVHSQYVEIT